MSLEVSLNLSYCRRGMRLRESLKSLRSARHIFSNKYPGIADDRDWMFSIDNIDYIEDAMDILQSQLPSGQGPVFQRVIPEVNSRKDLLVSKHVLLKNIGNINDRDIPEGLSGISKRCSHCGSPFVSVDDVKRTAFPALAEGIDCASYPGDVRILGCGLEFYKLFTDNVFTGMYVKGTHRSGSVIAMPYEHKWKNRDAVCDACNAHTSVTTEWGLFNCNEKFKYDIQVVRTRICEMLVLSTRLYKFLNQKMALKVNSDFLSSAIPHVPNMYSDIIAPEPIVFIDGTFPQYMLKKSWPRKAGHKKEGRT